MDAIDAATRAIAAQSMLAPAFAFLAGAATALGPCTASRMIAVVGLTGAEPSRSRRLTAMSAMVTGLCCGYVAIGYASYGVSTLMRQSALLYAVGAIVLGVIGIRTIVGARTDACSTNHVHPNGSRASLGAAFMIGASMALIVSPCCTPIIASMVAFGIASGRLWLGIATLGAFALGHAVPMVGAGLGASRASVAFARFSVPLATVSGSLLIGLAGYYAVLS